MNKSEFVSAVAEDAKLTKVQAGAAVDAFINVVKNNLKKGEDTSFKGFGSFSTQKRAARKGHNPQTGKEIKIAAKKIAKFKFSSEIKKDINND